MVGYAIGVEKHFATHFFFGGYKVKGKTKTIF